MSYDGGTVTLPTTPAQIEAFVRRVKAQAESPSGDGGSMGPEHDAVLNLVPRAQATHVAIANGDWTDPATWYQGRVPGADAKVLIPHGVSVTYDGLRNASLFTVRVDGELTFATDVNTRMVVDTLVVAPTGKLEIGSEDAPIAANVKADIVIANNGAINANWDTMLFSRGVVSVGEVSIQGAEKDTYLKVAAAPMAGSRTIQLADSPDGWRVGDTIVLTGTHKQGWTWSDTLRRAVLLESQDEEVTITAINGNRLTIDRALRYDHDTPRADLSAYVSNMTRSVTIRSEDGENTPVSQRGHVMLMHSDKVDVRYAALDDLGRTDKSRPAFDVGSLSDVTSTSNVKGRYPLHLHKTGLGDMDDPAMVVGNAVSGSPGWGFAHHTANAVFADNAAYDVFGAAFAAEDGDEIGSWVRNIAIKTEGVAYGESAVKDAADLARHDNGRTGDGFFFAGRLVDAKDNVAANTTQGYVWMHRSAPNDPAAETVDYPEIGYGKSTIRLDQAPIQGFYNNEAFGTQVGLIVVKASPQQEHDVRTVMDGFLNWETSTGMEITYTAHYTIKNVDLIGTENERPIADARTGFRFGGNTYDVVVNGLKIDGFTEGVDFSTNTFTFPVLASDIQNILIDVEMSDVDRNYTGFDAARYRVMSSNNLVVDRLSFASTGDRTVSWNETLFLNGIKTNSIGTRPRQFASADDYQAVSFYNSIVPILQSQGYYTNAGRKVIVLEDFIADRATGDLVKFSQVITIDLTPAQLDYIGAINKGAITLGGRAPVAVDDRATTSSDKPVVIDVLANDRDPEGARIVVDGMTQPRFGDVMLADDGRSILYMPGVNVSGVTDTFRYWVADGAGNFTPGTVTVTLTGASGGGVTLRGSSTADLIYGREGDDFLYGLGGNDKIGGRKGNDQLFGGAGNDVLRGGAGDDLLVGGAGNDRFDMGGRGADTIQDFQQGADRIVFSSMSDINSMSDLTITRSGGDTLIRYAGGTVLVLNAAPSEFTAADFLF